MEEIGKGNLRKHYRRGRKSTDRKGKEEGMGMGTKKDRQAINVARKEKRKSFQQTTSYATLTETHTKKSEKTGEDLGGGEKKKV